MNSMGVMLFNCFQLVMTLLVTIEVDATRGFSQVLKGQTDQFGESICNLSLELEPPTVESNVAWRIVSSNRVLGSGLSRLRPSKSVHADDQETWSFEFNTPKINPGIVLNAELYFRINDSKSETNLPLRLRAANSFTSIQKTLHNAGIALLDPNQKTASVLKELQVDIRIIESLKSVSGEQIVLLGESGHWEKRHWIAVDELVEAGKRVIVLRPSDDSLWPVNCSGKGLSMLSFGQLRGSHWFPKQLDTDFWQLQTEFAMGLEINVRRNELLMNSGKGPQIWQIAEYQTNNRGNCLFVGVPLVSCWNESPVPRELLANMFLQSLQSGSAETAASQP